MPCVSDEPRPGIPGERRLERPPSDRYRSVDPEPEPAAVGSPARGVALGAVVAILGAVAITVTGGLLTITAGLLVVAGLIGWAVAVAVVSGGGAGLTRTRRAPIAATLAIAGAALGQVGLWLLARQEGGVLPLIDYLGETFGILVPLEIAIAALVAWWRAR
jgi:hypothetical protein